MANRRMIASDFFEDDFVGCLDHLGRLLWIGLFTAVADDQGRMIDSTALMRARIFLFDNVSDEQIETVLNRLWTAKKIIRYEKCGKKLIQITKWWTYQTPSWASPSKFPAPDNWVDREKYHASGNKIVTNNWDNDGGLHSQLYSAEGRAIEEGKGNVKGEGNGDVNDEVEGKDSENDDNDPSQNLLTTFSAHSKVDLGAEAETIAAELSKKGVISSDVINAINFLNNKPGYKCTSFKSIRAPALIEMERRKGKKKPEDDRKRYLKGEYGDIGKHW